jgi:hypothetical protein
VGKRPNKALQPVSDERHTHFCFWENRMVTRLAILILTALILPACSIDETDAFMDKREAKKKIARVLRDPDSAEFRNVNLFQMDRGPMVCGEVNSNNAFGGKTGFQRFLFRDPLIRIGNDAASNAAIARCCAYLAETGTTGGAKISTDVEACAALDPPMLLW